MTAPETLILVAYFFVLSILGIYGWHHYLVYEYMKNKDRVPGRPPHVTEWPVVTIQLPIYNEMYVVDRLVDAVCDIDYPKDRLEIQVLDDSTDETTEIARLAVQRHAARGFDITYLHRTDRTGYKAGALDAGAEGGQRRVVAIFDADFVPPADFLQRTVP
jgi:cellulose synthase/poly-beta-1,6-N-acetylglucosamine synthase-like glycosyltransferase